ncbi:ABC transporter permease [Priestia megaterium]|uniref:ABC transporter permease n=1 Tax=Priestia megaterium TaxID=1404 RepID=UPI00234E5FCA|nr:ABC transporter permease [Priestia megaterium]MDC7783990.1 ABC transporter permease [Priestia megaterium]
MLNMIAAEFLKLKRTRIFWLIIIGNIIPLISNISYLIFSNNEMSGINSMTYIKIILSLLLAPLLFGIVSSAIFIREYQEENVILYKSYSYEKNMFYLSKLITSFIIIGASLFFILGTNYLLCMLFSNMSINLEFIRHELIASIQLLICQFALAIISVIATLYFKSHIAGIIVTIGGLLTSLLTLVANLDVLRYYNPYYISLIIEGLSRESKQNLSIQMGWIVLLLIIVIFLGYRLFEKLEDN